MSSNELIKAPESGTSAANPDQTLVFESLDTMIQAFKDKADKKAESPSFTDSTTPATADGAKFVDGVLDAGAKEVAKAEKIKPEFFKKDEGAQLRAAVSDADDTVAGMPLLDKQIAKIENRVQQLGETSQAIQQNISDTVMRTFSKTDYREFGALGPNQLTNPNPKLGFEVNPQQRAWLKENHPDIYKMLEKHDRNSLESSNTQANLNELVETRDRPIQARLDLAHYEQRIGMGDSAIKTLTELANKKPSVIEGNHEFRQMAIDTGAAWNPAFRKAIERNGGNILDFVHRPKMDFKVPPKPVWEEEHRIPGFKKIGK
jgi:hypothetical protein